MPDAKDLEIAALQQTVERLTGDDIRHRVHIVNLQLRDTDKDAEIARLKERDDDIATVAGFVAGWWPGLEDGLTWPPPDDHSVLLAAKRLVSTTSGTAE